MDGSDSLPWVKGSGEGSGLVALQYSHVALPEVSASSWDLRMLRCSPIIEVCRAPSLLPNGINW